MSQALNVHITSRFRRDAQKLMKQHPELEEVLVRLRAALRGDPHNHTREPDIAKLTGVTQGKGQWRIRVGDYRLRYDIIGRDVVLYSFRHRREVYQTGPFLLGCRRHLLQVFALVSASYPCDQAPSRANSAASCPRTMGRSR